MQMKTKLARILEGNFTRNLTTITSTGKLLLPFFSSMDYKKLTMVGLILIVEVKTL